MCGSCACKLDELCLQIELFRVSKSSQIMPVYFDIRCSAFLGKSFKVLLSWLFTSSLSLDVVEIERKKLYYSCRCL